jgi:hypothetical protein
MRASGYERAAADYYIEPRWCVEALLGAEKFTGVSWDPSCGSGNIPITLAKTGMTCLGSDIADRGYGETHLDFFSAGKEVDNIISNPPYGLIEKYVHHALTLASQKVALLARLALLEGQKRRSLFQNTPIARVWVSSRRISMPPGGTNIEPKGGAIAYAWFVWEHGHSGPPTLGWV